MGYRRLGNSRLKSPAVGNRWAYMGTLLVLVVLGTGVLAQRAAYACSSAQHRQFDFWLGKWSVTTPDGKKAGDSVIVSVSGGCALLESWTGKSGVTGKSLNAFDPSDGKWRQFWVDSGGDQLTLEGKFTNGSMVLIGQALDRASGRMVAQRITWTPNSDSTVRQLWESSTDNKTWTVQFDGTYARAP